MSTDVRQRVLITGAFGYVGGRLARHLRDGGFSVVHGTRGRAAAPHWFTEARVVQMDFANPASLRAACDGIDAIVHLAGANAQSCAADPALALEANAVVTARLTTAAASMGVRRFIYVSTAHVYASPLSGRIDELTCARGRHPYATSHRAGEDVVLHARARNQLEGAAIRLSNSFGPPMDARADCWMLLVNDLCMQAVSVRRLTLASSGLQRRDFITLSDACAALTHLLLLPATALGDGLFNLGGAWAPTVREMAERIAAVCPAALGFDVSVHTGAAAAGERSEELDYRIDKLLATGFSPRGAVDEEIRATLDFCAARVRGESR